MFIQNVIMIMCRNTLATNEQQAQAVLQTPQSSVYKSDEMRLALPLSKCTLSMPHLCDSSHPAHELAIYNW